MTDNPALGSASRLPRQAHLIVQAAARLSDRDLRIITAVHKHQVLTTGQVARWEFTGIRRAEQRLAVLRDLGALIGFRPWRPTGSAPMHHVLGPLGAQVLAAGSGKTVADVGYRPALATSVALRPDLAHLVGVNELFTTLIAAARSRDDSGLDVWRSERACTREWGAHVRPDGFGRWHDGARSCDFFLEHDTGSMSLAKVTAKLSGYAALAKTTGISTPVLFHLPSAAREKALRERITEAGTSVPVATGIHGVDPAAACWWPLIPGVARVALAELPAYLPVAAREQP